MYCLCIADVLLMYPLCIMYVLIRPYMPPHVPWRRLESPPAIVINFTKVTGAGARPEGYGAAGPCGACPRAQLSMTGEGQWRLSWKNALVHPWDGNLGGYRMPIPVGVPRVVKGDQKGHVVCGSS
jgi:hypothetical protein